RRSLRSHTSSCCDPFRDGRTIEPVGHLSPGQQRPDKRLVMLHEMLDQKFHFERLARDAQSLSRLIGGQCIDKRDGGKNWIDGGDVCRYLVEHILHRREEARRQTERKEVCQTETPVDGVNRDVSDSLRPVRDEHHTYPNLPTLKHVKTKCLDSRPELSRTIRGQTGRQLLHEGVTKSVPTQ